VILPIIDTPLGEPVRVPGQRAAAWNTAFDPAIVPAPGAPALVARLRAPGTLVVTTGQQAGLFTGPSYAVTKALSARGLALALERRWGRPVVPVYWIPGDDHDFEEVAAVSWLDGEGRLATASLPPRAPDAPLTPMWRQPLGNGVTAALDAFERSFPASETREATVAWLRRHYRPDATVAGAYAAALAELLTPLGILCVESTHPAVKQAAAPHLLRALEQAAVLDRELVAAAAELVAAGRDPGVAVGDGASLVFLDGGLGRDRLVAGPSGFVTRRGHSVLGMPELARIAAKEPTRLSGNVLLRPVLESALLPTVAYVAGPGELRYLALAAPVYQRLGVPRQLPVPRWAGFLLEARVTRTLEKFGATLDDLLTEGTALEARIARQALPEGTERAFAGLREAIESNYDPVIRAAATVDPTMQRPAATARGQALHAVHELEKKLLQHARKREATELAQVARARLSIRPEGKPQERVLSMAGFLARYGSELLGSLAEHIEGWYARALEAAPPTA
jgi:bacillithiol biosynthesis cysteine-adding enzyme BshC